MTPDLTLLLWVVILAFAQLLLTAIAINMQVPLSILAGNRANMPDITGWGGRAIRAYRNTMESLPMIVAVVLIAHLAGRATPTVILGEQIVLGARVAHAVLYTLGIAWLRSAAWLTGAAGMVMIALQLF